MITFCLKVLDKSLLQVPPYEAVPYQSRDLLIAMDFDLATAGDKENNQ